MRTRMRVRMSSVAEGIAVGVKPNVARRSLRELRADGLCQGRNRNDRSDNEVAVVAAVVPRHELRNGPLGTRLDKCGIS